MTFHLFSCGCRCLVAIVEHLIPKDYYSKTLVASQADQRVLKDLLAEKLPRLNNHFETLWYVVILPCLKTFQAILPKPICLLSCKFGAF